MNFCRHYAIVVSRIFNVFQRRSLTLSLKSFSKGFKDKRLYLSATFLVLRRNATLLKVCLLFIFSIIFIAFL
jgi:hypothetical protein